MILTKENINSIDLREFSDSYIRENRLEEILFVSPTNRKNRNLIKELIDKTPQGAAGQINVETINSLSFKLLKYIKNYRLLSEAAAAVLMRQSVEISKLEYFSNYKRGIPEGTLEKIKNAISEYKRHGITPDILLKESNNLIGAEKSKTRDIAEIYKNYQTKCDMLPAKEIGDIYFELSGLPAENFAKSFYFHFPYVDAVVIEGFNELSVLEIEILNNISHLKNIKLFLNFDYYEKNPLIFSHLDKCYEALRRKDFKPIIDKSAKELSEFHKIIRENLFINSLAEPLPYKEEIIRIIGSDKKEEIDLIAKEIKNLILDQSAEPHRICVAFNLISNYSPIIRDVFNLYNLPFNLTDRIKLSNSQVVSSIINFLSILESDFYYKNIFRALSGGYIDLPNADFYNLRKAAVDLKITIGANNWRNSLEAAMEANSFDHEEDEFVKGKSEIYKSALNCINLIYDLLKPFDKKLSPGEFINALIELIKKLKVDKLAAGQGDKYEEERVRALSAFLSLVEETFGLLEFEFGGGKLFDFSFLFNRLKIAASNARFNVREKSNYGIQITTIDEIRGLKFDYLFIAGMVDGEFPARYSPEIFLSTSYQKLEFARQTEERYKFYQALNSRSKKLYLSNPLKEKNKEFAESNFLKDFQNLFICEVKTKLNYNDFVYSEYETLADAGLYGIDSIAEKFKIFLPSTDWNDIKRRINIHKARLPNKSVYNGYLLSGNSTEDLIKSLSSLREIVYSASRLETYAKCPFRYFTKYILELRTSEKPTEEFEAYELGELIHKILYEFYKLMDEMKIVICGSTEKNFQLAQKRLFEIAVKYVEEARLSSPHSFLEKEMILGFNGDKKKSILHKFLELEKAGSSFIPKYFEISFGSKNDDDSESVRAGSVKIKGRIDRIDVNGDENLFSVVDYKSRGREIKERELLDGLALQIPIYMFAAKNLLAKKEKKDYAPHNGYIYSLRYKENKFGKKAVFKNKKEENISEATEIQINRSIEYINEYVDKISRGIFNLSELDNRETAVCRYCEYFRICRIKDLS